MCLFLGSCPGLGIIKLNIFENVFFFGRCSHLSQEDREERALKQYNRSSRAINDIAGGWHKLFGMNHITVYIAYLYC